MYVKDTLKYDTQDLKVYINWTKECFNSHSNLQIVTIFTVKKQNKTKHKIIVVSNKQKKL